MYVIVDIEWTEKENRQYIPTQLAAVRTDNNGDSIENFLEFIRPHGTERRECLTDAGGIETGNTLIHTQGLRDAFSDFLSWVADEDTLLFRHARVYR